VTELNDVFADEAPVTTEAAAAAVLDTLPTKPKGKGPKGGGSTPKVAPPRPTAERLAQMRPMGDVEYDDDGAIRRVEFTVPGKPLTWQRARRGKTGPYFTPEDRLSKMAEVRDAWFSLGLPPFAKETWLRMQVAVFCTRPKTHFRANGDLKPWALSEFPGSGTNGGDIDNFAKLPKDALNLVAYHDDAQIVGYLAGTGKQFVEPGRMPRTVIAFEPVRPVDIAEVDGEDTLILQLD
jgi:Holliday junction resolvase RusA-like endonuclease